MHLRHFKYALFLFVVFQPMIGLSQTPKSGAKKIYVPNKSSSAKTKVFGSASSPIVKQSTFESKNRTEIRFDVTLGEPISTKVNVPIKNASGLTFNRMSWSEIMLNDLPKGASISMIAEEGKPLIPYLILPIAVPFDVMNITPSLSNTDKKTIANTYLSTLTRRPKEAVNWEGFKRAFLNEGVTGEQIEKLRSLDVWDVKSLEEISNGLAQAAGDVWY